MSESRIADRKPAVVELAAGRYSWCACGASARQPFCDGSHRGTTFQPLRFEVTESRTAALCQCKRTATAPYCDGAHKRLPAQDAKEER